MDVPGAISEIARLKGAVSELREDDKQVCLLVAFLCEVLCDIDPSIRDQFVSRIDERLNEDFAYEHPQVVSRARTLHYGLTLIRQRLEKYG